MKTPSTPLVFIFALVISFSSFAQTSLNSIKSFEEFKTLSNLPLTSKYGNVKAVKVVVDLRNNQIYFLNGKHYQYHYEFCLTKQYGFLDLEEFNKVNYSNHRQRRFLLANINYYQNLEKYVLELSPSDIMSDEHLKLLIMKVKEATYFDELQFLLNNARLLSRKEDLISSGIGTISPDEIYGGLTFQVISEGINYGVLKFIYNLKEEQASIQPYHIVVLKETPLYLPEVAGVIVAEFQTPLSHLCILGNNRELPIAVDKMAFEDEKLRSLANQRIKLSVKSDAYSYAPSTRKTKTLIRSNQINLKYDLSVTELIDFENTPRKLESIIGGKAANFAHLYALSKSNAFKVPEASFAIPFYFYNQHVSALEIKRLIDEVILQQTLSYEETKEKLKAIRKAIKEAEIDNGFLNLVENKIKEYPDYNRFRFRSSTNAEDIKGFSGAGLYVSKTGILNDNNKSVSAAIKSVWASLWTYEAFTERNMYGIDHRKVCMGILVHRSFPNEAVNGVVVTKNLYRPGNYGFVVNAQLGNENVVNPKPGIVSDQFICYPKGGAEIYSDKQLVEVISISNLNNGALVLQIEEIETLANELNELKQYFYRKIRTGKSFIDFGLDVEFKLDGPSRDLYIKQARYYND